MDKFDFTFLFGDLNFRLDISRLHADWLLSRQGQGNLNRHSVSNLTSSGQNILKPWDLIS
jgi:hypothetical protein